MKRFLLLSFFACVTVLVNAQVPFVPYRPAQGNPGNNSYNQRQQQQRENLQTVNAYFVNQRGSFEKIRIKVSITQDLYGFTSVYVRGYCDKTYNQWRDVNSKASEIDALDSDVIKENFDYKCYIQYVGTVYF